MSELTEREKNLIVLVEALVLNVESVKVQLASLDPLVIAARNELDKIRIEQGESLDKELAELELKTVNAMRTENDG